MRGALGLALAMVAAACSAPPDDLPPVIASSNITLVKAVSYPGGATRLTVRLHEEDGSPLADGGLPGMQLGGSPAAFESRPAVLAPGHTLVVFVPPDDAGLRSAAADGVAQLLAARPAGERVALYWFEDALVQLRNFDDDHAELAAAAELLATRPRGGGRGDLALMASTAGALVTAIGGEADDGMRAVIVVGAIAAPPAVPLTPSIQWVVAGSAAADTADAGAGRVVRVEEFAGDWGLALGEAAARIDAAAAGAHHELAICADPIGEPAVVALDADRTLELMLPPSLPEEAGLACDAAAALAGERIFPDRIDFLFTAEQRTVYDQRVAAESRADFDLTIRMGEDRTPITAVAHLRGKGSMGCDRKGYTVDLDGPRPRHTMPGSASDEFYLLSLCLDDRYVHQYAVLSMWQRIGLFPMKFRLVELTLDGETRGLYMLVEHVSDEVRLDNAGVASVLRRGYSPPDTTIEIKYARDGDTTGARDSYTAALDAAALTGDALMTTLGARLDLDRYLLWLGSNAVLRNGDYVDEVWMTGVDHMDAAGAIVERYQFAGWDPEDVFTDCHYMNRWAFVDDYGLTYCAEGEWDHAVLANPAGYARYVDLLDRLLTEQVPDAVFAQILDDTEAALTPLLSRPEIAAAMIELVALNPAAVDPQVALAEIRAELDAMAAEYAARRTMLLEQIAAYRAAN